MGADGETHSQALGGTQGAPQKRGRKDCRRQRDWRTPGEHSPLNQPIQAHMGLQTVKS